SGAPPDPDNFDEFVDLSHTVQFLGSQVLDASGHPIFGATITADSGFDYTAGAPSVSSVPEAPAFAYMALGLSGGMFGRWKKHRKVSRATAWLKSSLWMLARAIECPPRLSWNTSSTHHDGQSAASRPEPHSVLRKWSKPSLRTMTRIQLGLRCSRSLGRSPAPGCGASSR